MNKEILVFKDLTKIVSREKVIIDKSQAEIIRKNLRVGDLVSHIRFGEGRVSQIDGDIISLDFYGEKKMFPFPSAFLEGYIQVIEE